MDIIFAGGNRGRPTGGVLNVVCLSPICSVVSYTTLNLVEKKIEELLTVIYPKHCAFRLKKKNHALASEDYKDLG